MSNKGAELPPPYTASGQGFDQYPMQSQQGGQTNYGFNQNMPQHTPYMAQHTSMNNVIVTQVGGFAGPVYQPDPYDYTAQAWIACLCCFWPTGLMAIMKATESRDALARGDMAGAHAAANSARTMVRISYVLGILSIVVAVVIIAVWFGVIANRVYCGYNC